MPILDHNGRRLGALPAKPEKLRRVLKLEHFTTSTFGEFVPPGFDWFQGVQDYMDLNDTLGDCVVATQAKMVRSWTANSKFGAIAVTITDAEIKRVYMDGAGYNPADPATDQGWDLLSALSYWQRKGIGGHKIGPYASVDPTKPNVMRAAAFLGFGLYIALDLPNSIWSQEVWSVVSHDGGPAGGHCVTIQAVVDGLPVCRTWGAPQRMTWEFVAKYCTEAYIILSPDCMTNGRTVTGLDVARLTAAMNSLKG